ncbi:amidohydrolase family protein [Pseudoxanthomonas mexicana]|uniref:amidohydrolase family protein n=1 Tax=Pseudoxanthomonas mexicana TaxID=128785 RepID=UPI00398AB044
MIRVRDVSRRSSKGHEPATSVQICGRTGERRRVPALAGTAARAVLLAACAAASFAAAAQDLLIRNATVHTAGPQGTLQAADVLVQGGVIRAVGSALSAPAGVAVVEAGGKPLTPALFGGITAIGIEEVSGESATDDASLTLKEQPVRPEFDVTLAYNPASVLIPVARVEGLGFTLLGATTGGAFVAGQGGVVRLDGSADPIGSRALFIRLGSAASGLSGNSRAAQWMLLDQLVAEARGRMPADSPHALLTPAGRATLARYLAGQGRIVVAVNRAADIRQLLRWAAREKVRIAIAGGAEAWKLAPQLAQAQVPVLVDALADLPADFDQIGATLENAARLHAAGVAVAFTQAGDASHNARKVRQLAGNAVANGLPWEAGLAGLTRIPAQAFGVAEQIGTIAPGRRADLVLWSGDPLDVAHTAEQVWLDGRAQPMRSRQTELRDRYLRQAGPLPRAYD